MTSIDWDFVFCNYAVFLVWFTKFFKWAKKNFFFGILILWLLESSSKMNKNDCCKKNFDHCFLLLKGFF